MSTIREINESLVEDEGAFPGNFLEIVEEIRDFFADLPEDLDLASAAFYLKKEFKRNSTGIDDRYNAEIFTAEPEVYDDWDSDDDVDDDDYDEDASWREDYY